MKTDHLQIMFIVERHCCHPSWSAWRAEMNCGVVVNDSEAWPRESWLEDQAEQNGKLWEKPAMKPGDRPLQKVWQNLYHRLHAQRYTATNGIKFMVCIITCNVSWLLLRLVLIFAANGDMINFDGLLGVRIRGSTSNLPGDIESFVSAIVWNIESEWESSSSEFRIASLIQYVWISSRGRPSISLNIWSLRTIWVYEFDAKIPNDIFTLNW
jgi:hypothetical protein